MNNVGNHAKREIEILCSTNTDPNNRPIIEEFKDEIIALCEKFGNSGQSGGSAPYTASAISQAIKHLCMFEVIAPLTGEDDEWGDIRNYGGKMEYQNKRDSGVFKNSDGTVTYNNDVIKRCPDGGCWSGPLYLTREDALNSKNRLRFKVKGFPFKPKTFYIDVLEEEVEKDDWIMWVKDPKQLDEVYEYYDKY